MNPYVLLGVAVMWGLSLFAVGKWQRTDGATSRDVFWQAKQNDELAAANAKIVSLNADARAKEKAHAEAVDAIAKKLVKENQDAEVRLRRAVADARSLVLRQPPIVASPGGSPAAAPVTTTGGRDAQARCELPATAVRDLLVLVGDADRDVRQLASCQAVVEADRLTCKGSP